MCSCWISSIVASEARQQTGFPPNVLAWLPGGQSITTPDDGITPDGGTTA